MHVFVKAEVGKTVALRRDVERQGEGCQEEHSEQNVL